MKLRESFRFPYPVLNETAHDYLSDRIDLLLLIDERPASGALKISYELTLESQTIQCELDRGSSRLYLSVVCRDTFLNELYNLSSSTGAIEIPAGLLYGRVEVRAITARLKDGYMEASGLPHDYSSTKFEVAPGSVIAWTLPQSFTVGMEKLAPMESVFHLAADDSLPEGTLGISYDDEHITILAPEKLLATIHAMRNNSSTRALALNAIYLPAVMTVLGEFKDGSEFSERRWHKVIQAKADLLGFDLVGKAPLEAAQRLLKQPAARLTSFMEKFE